jgi:hypothetical protein
MPIVFGAKLAKRVFEQLTNIQHLLSGLDKRWSVNVGVCDPTNNNQSQQDRHHTYRRCVITLFPNHSRALQSEEHPYYKPSATSGPRFSTAIYQMADRSLKAPLFGQEV